MNNSKILIFIMLLLIIPTVSAIGVVPASKEVLLGNSDTSYELKIINQQQEQGEFEVEIIGDLTKYVTTNKNRFIFNKDTKEETIKIFLTKPQEHLDGGEYTTRIIIKKINIDTSQMVAQVGLASRLVLTVPYDDAAGYVELIAPNFEKGKQNSFSVNAFNKGIKDANNCKVVLDIETSLNTKAATLVSPAQIIPKKSKTRFLIPWTPELENGHYIAKADLICDNTQAHSEKEFKIGTPTISINSFNSDNFKLGSINRFDLILSSNWGEEISGIFADIEVLFDEKQKFTTITESRTVQALGKEIIPTYIDTKGFEPGAYTIIVTLHYLGKEISEVFKANMGNDKVVVNSVSGNVIGQTIDGESEESGQSFATGMNLLLILIILIVVVINALLGYKLLKKK